MKTYAIVRTNDTGSREVISHPLCAGCLPGELALAHIYDEDYGICHAAGIVCIERNHQERCGCCEKVVIRAPRTPRGIGNQWNYA